MESCNLDQVLANKDSFKGLSRKHFEIVITRFNEDLSWTDGIEHLCTVYNKGEPFSKGACKVLPVPNHGVGSETMLRHMVEEYHDLANVTLFCQGTLCDRVDQPLYPLTTYAACGVDGIVCVKTDLYDMPRSRYLWRISSSECRSVGDLNLATWRKQVLGIPFRGIYESWVRGDWIAVGCDRIRRRSKKFYMDLYDVCQFQRGILVEECWFLERSFYSILQKT
jgi:hypothetical protein